MQQYFGSMDVMFECVCVPTNIFLMASLCWSKTRC